MRNWSRVFLQRYGKTVDDYLYHCYDLSEQVREWLKAQKIKCSIKFIYPNNARTGLVSIYGDEWRYHAVPTIGGVVHDAWCEEVLELREYALFMFKQNSMIVSGTYARGYRRRRGGILIERPKLV